MAKFGQIFKEVNTKKPQHPEHIVEWIHYKKLISSKYQYCDAKTKEEILNLADIIQSDGEILQNLYIRNYDTDNYEIIAGHKRRMAVQILVEERGLDDYAFLPCIVSTKNEIQTRFSVISSNAHHTKTPYEIMHEIEEMTHLLKTHPEEFGGKNLSGRMVERLAKQLSMSRSVISDYKNIAHNLGEMAMKEFENNNISKSAATALASLDKEEQDKLVQKGVTSYTGVSKYKEQKLDNKKNRVGEEKAKDISVPKVSKHQHGNNIASTSKIEIESISKAEPVVTFGSEKNLREYYEDWSIWTRNVETEEIFYRKKLQDGVIAVVRSFPRYFEETQEEYMDAEYYLLSDNYRHFADCLVGLDEFEKHVNNKLGQ